MNKTTSQTPETVTPAASSLLQRACACGQHTGGAGCSTCEKERLQRSTRNWESGTRDSRQPLDAAPRTFFQPRFGHDFSHVRVHSGVQRTQRQRTGRRLRGPTNYAFDTYNVTEAHLSDPDIVARLNALSIRELVEYRSRVSDPAVQAFITNLIVSRPTVPCTATQVSRTNARAETARTASLPWIGEARVALDRLHSRWTTYKAELVAGSRTLAGEVVCAFNSNFNITPRDPDYGVRQISVMSRLRALESRISRAVSYTCQPENDPVCLGTNQDTVAYVRGGLPPIHFCPQFQDETDAYALQGTVIHEYAHLLPGVHDRGGYALGGFGAQIMTCQTGAKFSAASDVLTNTADALTGFVMHIGQIGSSDIRVR